MVLAADLRDIGETEPREQLRSTSADASPASCDAVSETRMSSSALNDDVTVPVTDMSGTDITVAVTSM